MKAPGTTLTGYDELTYIKATYPRLDRCPWIRFETKIEVAGMLFVDTKSIS